MADELDAAKAAIGRAAKTLADGIARGNVTQNMLDRADALVQVADAVNRVAHGPNGGQSTYRDVTTQDRPAGF
jgi:hypothetical protein